MEIKNKNENKNFPGQQSYGGWKWKERDCTQSILNVSKNEKC